MVPKLYRVWPIEFGLKRLSSNHSQGKLPSRLRLDQVQRLGPPTTLHDIIHYAQSNMNDYWSFGIPPIMSPYVLTYSKTYPLEFPLKL